MIRMQSRLKEYTQANREAWNEVMPRHQKAAREKWDQAFMQPGYVCIEGVELELLRRMGIKGRAAAHLFCNNSDILMALIEKRIAIEHFSECEADVSAGHERVEQAHAGIPLSYVLIGRKESLNGRQTGVFCASGLG